MSRAIFSLTKDQAGQSVFEYIVALVVIMGVSGFALREMVESPGWERFQRTMTDTLAGEFTYGDGRVASTTDNTGGGNDLHPESGGRFFGPRRR